MTALVVRANAASLPLPDSSVDLVVTSPPYFALRSYQDGGEHYAGQVGAEATPADFIDALIAVTAECMRVLKPTGSIWVNLGDKYGPNKSLAGLPWRYAHAVMDRLGLILRAEVIWSKPNGLPESVTDRVRRSHEQWFHFTKEPRYFAAVDEVREPHGVRHGGGTSRSAAAAVAPLRSSPGQHVGLDDRPRHPLGKLPGSVWTVPTQPLRVPDDLGVDHFAAFPTEWPRRIISGWSPPGGTILDPFGGTGTTAMTASVLGRVGISVDLSHDYCRLAQWRTQDEKERARVNKTKPKPKPPAAVEPEVEEHPDQLGLFGEDVA